MSQQHAPSCQQCAHFQVTHDSKNPMACRHFGFKTRHLPSLEVLVTTGKQCIFFEAKARVDDSSSLAVRPGHSLCITA